MVILREILEIGLELGNDLGLLRRLAALPIGGAEAVVLDEFLLALEHELWESAAAISFNRLHLQQRRLFIVAILEHERAVAVGRIGKALFLRI